MSRHALGSRLKKLYSVCDLISSSAGLVTSAVVTPLRGPQFESRNQQLFFNKRLFCASLIRKKWIRKMFLSSLPGLTHRDLYGLTALKEHGLGWTALSSLSSDSFFSSNLAMFKLHTRHLLSFSLVLHFRTDPIQPYINTWVCRRFKILTDPWCRSKLARFRVT